MGKIAWQTAHAFTAVTWSYLLLAILYELATTGDLARTANEAGHYSAGFALFMAILCSCSAATAFRAIWLSEGQ